MTLPPEPLSPTNSPPPVATRAKGSVLVVECDRTWRLHPLQLQPCSAPNRRQLEGFCNGSVELIPLTPGACLCVTDDALDRQQPANALASALLGFLQLPTVRVLSPACVTGDDGSAHPAGAEPAGPHLVRLIDVEQRGFSRTLPPCWPCPTTSYPRPRLPDPRELGPRLGANIP